MPYCPSCGSNVTDPNAQTCPNCGAPLTAATAPASPSVPPAPPASAYTPPMSTMTGKNRPTGIVILVVLQVLGALAFLLGGAAFLIFGGLLATLGGLLIILGLASFAVAWGLWTGKGWAWTVSLVLAALSVLLNIVGIARGDYTDIIGIIIPLIIVYYLTRPHVKVFYGK